MSNRIVRLELHDHSLIPAEAEVRLTAYALRTLTERFGDDIAAEQRARAEPAREVQLGQGAGQRQFPGQPHARLERRRHHARQPARLGDGQRTAHPA